MSRDPLTKDLRARAGRGLKPIGQHASRRCPNEASKLDCVENGDASGDEQVRSNLLNNCLIAEVSNSMTEDLKLAFDYRGLTGLYPRLNGWNTYAPARPWLVK